jgi:nucleoside-diphosphate-sugar epimerase
MTKRNLCVLTGASGYVGRYVADHMEKAGWEVVELGRRPTQESTRLFVRWELGTDPPSEKVPSFDLLVHCAWDFFASDFAASNQINVEGSKKLLDWAKQSGAAAIFVSTISAFEGAQTIYGKSKFAVEQLTRERGGWVIRPGLLWGPTYGGMLEALRRLISRSRVLPVPGAQTPFYMCHIADLCEAILYVSTRRERRLVDSPLLVFHPQPVRFVALLKAIASQGGHQLICVPIPWRPLYWILKAAEQIGFRSRLRSDSLLSMMTMDRIGPLEVSSSIPVSFRPIQ